MTLELLATWRLADSFQRYRIPISLRPYRVIIIFLYFLSNFCKFKSRFRFCFSSLSNYCMADLLPTIITLRINPNIQKWELWMLDSYTSIFKQLTLYILGQFLVVKYHTWLECDQHVVYFMTSCLYTFRRNLHNLYIMHT